MTSAPVALQHPLAPEDRARADLYALLARILAAPPDADLLAKLGDADLLPEEGLDLPAAYNRLLLASRAMDTDAAVQEYTELFIGVGRSEVNLHASHWRTGFMMDKPLAELRGDLAALGLERRDASGLLEDHLASLAETMRMLVAGGEGRAPATLDEQRRFFARHIDGWAFECCNAMQSSALSNYYRRVAEFAQTFLAIERDSFAIG